MGWERADRDTPEELLSCCCGFCAVCFWLRRNQHFDTQTGRCGQLLGEAEVDHCCMNPHYGYQGNDSVCHSCRRFCFGIGLCKDPKGLGDLQTKSCQERDCCPKPAGWSEWGSWQACSVSCSSGHRQRERTCSSPPPNCGGPGCSGPSKETSACHTGKVCPVHGGWSAWGPWEPCDGTCVREGSEPPRRHSARYCTNPAPSIDPPGQPCPESGHRWEYCKGLPFCPVHGGWGPWGEYSRCSVTCGLGAQVKRRVCDSPAPKHGGHACPGEATSTKICNTHQHCPVDGQWSEWGEWSGCNRSGKNIRCSTYSAGTQRRARTCEHREWEGKHCSGDIVETRPCYDIEKCRSESRHH
ncbi:hypothetical protein JZ751_014500 [Albula glossodonta]|uniref:Properdin n=1 Tax=Albula glossodonta TaxID=121402 RepID=A0A8T2N3Y9_9TELE|nr:hypothetical protein JZ751_014500 [Albula glossodonta]